MYQPGERWQYNIGSLVLGVLVARAAGRPLEAFLRTSLFEPLGMEDTGFSMPVEQAHRLPTQYATDFQTGTAASAHRHGGVDDAADLPVRRRRPALDGRRLPRIRAPAAA
jgi:CubicO group peptidase (beta-lactamase class C family)